jgi:hypothetical protein
MDSIKMILLALSPMLMAVTTFAQNTDKSSVSINSPASKRPSSETTYELKKGSNEFGVWQGFAFNTLSQLSGLNRSQTKGEKLALTGLRYGRVLASNPLFSFEYVLDVIPVASAIGTYTKCPEETNPNCRAGTIDARQRQAVYGFGLAPVGTKFIFLKKARAQPILNIIGGFLRFQKAAPVPKATKFNFTIEVDASLQILNRAHRALNLGAKLYHFSNAQSGQTNPGLTAVVYYIGYSIFKAPKN